MQRPRHGGVDDLVCRYGRDASVFRPAVNARSSHDFGDGAPVLFERLILPVLDGLEHLTHFVRMVLFSENAVAN